MPYAKVEATAEQAPMSDEDGPQHLVSRTELAALRDALAEHTGVHLRHDSLGLLEARLYGFAHERGREDVRGLLDAVVRAPGGELAACVIEALVNGETSFFRDLPMFEELREWVLPELIARRRSQRRLRLWSAACSTGQEPYSLALLLAEDFGEQLAGWDVRILATDISRHSIARAAIGSYSERDLGRGLSDTQIRRWFEPEEGGRARVGPALRQMIQFQRLNLIEPWPQLPPMDLVFVRNVLLYWPVALRVAVARKLATVVQADALVAVGGAEILPRLAEFRPHVPKLWPFFRLDPYR